MVTNLTIQSLIQVYRAGEGILSCGEDDSAAYILREAFAQALARTWALQVKDWHGPQSFYVVENIDSDSDERLLPYFEHPDIRILKLVVSVINGEGGAELYRESESFFDHSIYHYVEDYRVPPYRDLLRIRKCDIERFIKAIAESRPANGPDDLGPWHASNLPPF